MGSSLAHGDLSGTLLYLDRKIVERTGDSVVAETTGSIANLHLATLAAVVTINEAIGLYHRRRTSYLSR